MITLALMLVPLQAALADQRPHASDLWHFPHPSVCLIEMENAQARRVYLEAAKWMYPGQESSFASEIERVTRVYSAWVYLNDAYRIDSSRWCLEQLRENLGYTDYYEGRMPSLYPAGRR